MAIPLEKAGAGPEVQNGCLRIDETDPQECSLTRVGDDDLSGTSRSESWSRELRSLDQLVRSREREPGERRRWRSLWCERERVLERERSRSLKRFERFPCCDVKKQKRSKRTIPKGETWSAHRKGDVDDRG